MASTAAKNALFTAETQRNHDVILVSSNNVRFHIHKKHLTMFSSVFDDMFKLESVIDQDPVPIIPLPGDDSTVLSDMLPYFYPYLRNVQPLHDQDSTTLRRLQGGLDFADKYDLDILVTDNIITRAK